MRSEVLKVLEFTKKMRSVKRADLLLSGLVRRLAAFGVVSISLNLIHQPGSDGGPRVLISHRWTGWSKTYLAKGFIKDDPAVRMLQAQLSPFSWSESYDRFPSPAAKHVLDSCFHETGFREGYVVPVRDHDQALLTATFCGASLDLSEEARFALDTCGFLFAVCGRLLTSLPPPTSCPLTPRQLACLQGVKDGHGDNEIGAILRISRHTAHNHIEAVKRRLGFSRRALAAAEAWRRGWIL